MYSHLTFLALELARERAEEANAERLARRAHPAEARAAGVRRTIARVALAVARAADDDVERAR